MKYTIIYKGHPVSVHSDLKEARAALLALNDDLRGKPDGHMRTADAPYLEYSDQEARDTREIADKAAAKPRKDSSTATATKTANDGRQWYRLDGVDYGTGHTFDGAVYGITDDSIILDEDGCPLTEGNVETIAVRNTINQLNEIQ